MGELGIPVPDPGTVKLPLVAAPAGPDRADRPAAGGPRGGRGRGGRRSLQAVDRRRAVTDRLLREIRKEERSHSLAVQEIRGGHVADDGELPVKPPPPGRDAPIAVPGARTRLDRILGREKWHRTGGGWISGAIYGANDGLAAVFGIVAGVSGATGGSTSVLTAGLAGAIASALSMATGAYLAERSEHGGPGGEHRARAPGDRRASRGGEGGAVALLPAQGDRRADRRRARRADGRAPGRDAPGARGRGVRRHDRGREQRRRRRRSPPASRPAVGAIVPVIPFMITTGTAAIVAAAIVSLVAHFLVGAAKSLVTLRTWWSAGPGDDARRADRRRRYVPGGSGATDLTRPGARAARRPRPRAPPPAPRGQRRRRGRASLEPASGPTRPARASPSTWTYRSSFCPGRRSSRRTYPARSAARAPRRPRLSEPSGAIRSLRAFSSPGRLRRRGAAAPRARPARAGRARAPPRRGGGT